MTPRRQAILAFFSGIVFAAATPPLDWTVGILLGLVGFAVVLADGASSARRGWLFGFGANLVALRFVPEVVTRFTPLPYVAGVVALVLLSMAQALPWMAGAAVTRVVATRVRGMPRWLAFAIGVYAALFVPAVFPWTPAGGLAPWPILLQTAEVFGERGASFFVAIGSGLVATAIFAARTRRGLHAVAGAAAVFALLEP